MLHFSGSERVMDDDKIIVSKTDPTGRIAYASSYFLEISDFTLDDLLTQQHSIVRNPNVPRCIFKLLWERLKSGREVFAYLVNRSKGDDHYWVFAHVTPTIDERGEITGYHSNRRKPRVEALEKINELYTRLLAVEAGTSNRKAGLEASYQMLTQFLAEQGQDYEEYILTL